jgi:Flp pilus assembly protein protease CpaA
MGVECASCGQVIPSGQFRCGSCGAAQPRASFDDYGGMSELALDPPRPEAQAAGQTGGPRALNVERREAAAPVAEGDEAAREPAVPRGTFASVLPEPTPEEPPASAPEPPKGPKAVVVAAAPEPRTKSNRPPARPPYLASEILKEDLTPTEPGRKAMDLMLHVAPALGAVAVFSSGPQRVATWISLAVLASMFLLTRFELAYMLQAMLVAGFGGLALAVTASARVGLGGGGDGPILAVAATLLPAALLFRAWFRAAYTARVVILLALVLAATWATWTSHRNLLSLEFDWQSWVPALSWYLFGILCLLSLLAFMGEETTGGCDVWALGLWVWYGLFACARFALEGGFEPQPQQPSFQTLGLLEPALAAPTSVALAQLFARFFVSRPRLH